MKYVTKDKKIEIYDFANKVYGMNYQNRFLDNIIGSKSYLLNKPLTAPRVPRFINIFSQMFVEMALNGEHHWNMCIDVVSMLKSLPAEIRDGVIKKEGVKLDSAGTKVSSVREAIFYAATKSDRFYDYYAIYRDYGSMTQQEIENYEDVCILKGMREDYYKDRFPNGRYLGKDLDEVWVQVYINRVKAMLEANNKTLFTGTNNAELKRNMMVPMLSRSMGGHNEETSGVISFFIKTRPIFAFNQDAYMEEIAKSWNRINNKYKKPAGYEDAKLFRTLIDGIAIANIISYDSWQSRLQNSLEYWMGIQRMRIDEIEDETIQAARTLSAKYPSIKPACLKAESHIKEQFGRFEKLDAEVSPRHREELARIIKERRATNCKNCKVNGSQTTFPSGWKEEWSFLFFEIEPAQSKTSGRIVLLNGKEIEWKYVQSSGEKTKVKASGYINGTYDSVNEMITAFIVKCKNEYCD